MKLSEYVLSFFKSKGIDKVFLVNGGSIAFLIDAFRKIKNINYVCAVHEQGAAMMADGYARTKKKPGVTMVTSGPGAQNLITGIASSWFDSIPTIHICGQINSNDFLISKQKHPVRQRGFQETDIVSISKPITKFAYRLKRADEIEEILNKAYDISISGRPGPVLLDIPMNFQNQKIVLNKKFLNSAKINPKKFNNKKILKLKSKIINSKKPLLIVGGGIEISNTKKELFQFCKKTNLPVVASWAGFGSIDNNIKNFIGTIGVYGSRVANICLQKSDFIINLGCRLDTRVIGGKRYNFAPNAEIASVDIDKNELNKTHGLKVKYKVQADLDLFFKKFLSLKNLKIQTKLNWINEVKRLQLKYEDIQIKKNLNKSFVNPYRFFQLLSEKIKKNDIIVGDTGAHLTWAVQGLKIGKNNKLISSFGNSPMGYALPASIGACFSRKNATVISINGDASLQLNLQELQTIKNYKLKLKIFILNNSGYGIIKQFQDAYLNSRYEASNKSSGVTNPNFKYLAKSFDLDYVSIKNDKEIFSKLGKIFKNKKTTIVEINIFPNEKIIPKLIYGRQLDDMYPNLTKKDISDLRSN